MTPDGNSHECDPAKQNGVLVKSRHLLAACSMVAAIGTAGLAVAAPASAISGSEATPEGAYRFTVKLQMGRTGSCTGALIDPQWVVTSAACFTQGGATVTAGKPPKSTKVVVDRADLAGDGGQVVDAVEVVEHPTVGIALVLLEQRVKDVPTIRAAGSEPTSGESLRITGYGRTATEWAPDRLQSALFTVTDVKETSIGVLGAGSETPAVCKGDTGGPIFREGPDGAELVAVSYGSWQHGCIGETETRNGATGQRVDTIADWMTKAVQVPQLNAVRPSTTAVDGFTGFIRDPRDGAIYQVLKGVKYHLNPDEYRALGYPASPNVSADEIASHSASAPSGDAIIRDYGTGAVYQVVNGAKYHLNPDEYRAMGYPAYISVPPGFAARITGSVPSGDAIIRDYGTGAVYQVVNGAKYHLNPDEYRAMGYPAYISVPPGFAARITGSVPSGDAIIRDYGTGAVYQVVNGAKYHLNPDEYRAMGYPSYVSVPPGFAARVGSVPADGTNLRSLDTGNVYTVVSGRLRFVSADAWSSLEDKSYTDIPQGFVDALQEQ